MFGVIQMRILICEDERVLAEDISWNITAVFSRRGIEIEVSVCTSAQEFRDCAPVFRPDLILMDLGLGMDDGYTLIQEYRKTGSKAEIAFITAYQERMQDAFEYRPIGFVVKPANEANLEAIADRFLFYHGDDGYYRFETREMIANLPVKSILYFESEAHSVLIYCEGRSEPYRHNRKLDEIEAELSDMGFFRVHKSFLVNLRYVTGINNSRMRLLINCVNEIPVSRRYYNKTVQRLIELHIE